MLLIAGGYEGGLTLVSGARCIACAVRHSDASKLTGYVSIEHVFNGTAYE